MISSVASARLDTSTSSAYATALRALEQARLNDRRTGEAFHLTQWVRDVTGFEFVELEDADEWPPRVTYLVHLAARHELDQNWEAAIYAYQQTCELLDHAGSDQGLARSAEVGFHLALCLKQAGRWSEALKQQEANAAAYKKLGNPEGKANAYMEIGHIYQMMNLYDPALLYYGEAYYLYRQVAEEAEDETTRQTAQQGMANAKESLGNLEFQLKVLPKGIADLEDARKLYLDLDMPSKAAIIAQTLEDAQVTQGGHHA
jgi:tetratricopeptide (TPR) repeat protein